MSVSLSHSKLSGSSSKNKLRWENREGAVTQPCMMPLVTGNGCDVLHSGNHANMELPDQSDEPVRTAKCVHDLPQAIMAEVVKGLCQVHQGGVEADILFLKLLLHLR